MRGMTSWKIFLAISACTLLLYSVPAEGMDTAFSYQGRLHDGGSPANGTYDFRFFLYNAETGGSQIGATLYGDDISVNDGLFMMQLDFGPGTFTGNSLWLEVAVRPGASTGSYTTLSPRNAILPSPYSLHAATIEMGSVGSSEVQDNSLTASDLAPDSVGASEIGNGTVGSSEVADNSLTSADLGPSSVGSSEVADNSLTSADLGPSSVGTSEVADNSLYSKDIKGDGYVKLSSADLPCSGKFTRFAGCSNGTVTDQITGIVWLADADCLELYVGTAGWETAAAAVASLSGGTCGLTDGSSPGDWRLPTWAELNTLVVKARDVFNCATAPGPCVTNDIDDQCYGTGGSSSFKNVRETSYWTATGSYLMGISSSKGYALGTCKTQMIRKNGGSAEIWPVRKIQAD